MALERVQIILEKEQRKQIAHIAREEGKSVSEVTRELLRLALKERRKRQIERAAQILQEDYRNDPELTQFAALDGEDWDETR
ncbi:MAG: ribbon-helix-helix protein, CopG family [Bellilinea sp.]